MAIVLQGSHSRGNITRRLGAALATVAAFTSIAIFGAGTCVGDGDVNVSVHYESWFVRMRRFGR